MANGREPGTKAHENNQTDFNKTNTNITAQTAAGGMVSEYTFANKGDLARTSQPNGADTIHQPPPVGERMTQ